MNAPHDAAPPAAHAAGGSPVSEEDMLAARQLWKLNDPAALRSLIRQAALALEWHDEPLKVWAAESYDREDSDGSGLIGLALSPEGAQALARDHAGSYGEDQAEPVWTAAEDGFTADLFDDMLALTVTPAQVAL